MPIERPFVTLAGRGEAVLEERRSRFLAIAIPVPDRAAAERFHREQSLAHKNPSHVVPAFALRDGTTYSSDAGEPTGSSGNAVLAAIERAELTDVAVVVVRWFGGVKLGTGGLRRAYGEAAALALAGGARRSLTPGTRFRIRFAYAETAAVLGSLDRVGARDLDYDYGQEGDVELCASIAASEVGRLSHLLRDATRGRASLTAIAEVLIGA